MNDWITKHGAACTAAAAALGALIANFGGLPPEVRDALNGIVVAGGFLGAALHAFLNGLGGRSK